MKNLPADLGLLLQKQGQLDQAAAYYERVLELQPDDAETHHRLGRLRLRQGLVEEAEASFERTLELKPDHARARHSLGLLRRRQGRFAEAMAHFEAALEAKQDYAPAHNDLGLMLYQQGRLEEAARHFERALLLNPGLAAAHNNLGILLADRGQAAEAARCFQRALASRALYPEAHVNLAGIHKSQGELEEAAAHYRSALAQRPNYADALGQLVDLLQDACAWNELGRWLPKLDAMTQSALENAVRPGETPLGSIRRSGGPARHLAVARGWARSISDRVRLARVELHHQPRSHDRPRLRVGYLSGDFREHPVAHLIGQTIACHDRSRLEVLAYSYGGDDGSRYRALVERCSDRFADLRALSFSDAARRIHADQVDILVDLAGHTFRSRLEICALRPAPLQAAYLGFPGTTGSDFIDYLITDPILSPDEHRDDYSEQLVRLPHAFAADYAAHAELATVTRASFGLPEDAFVCCSFNAGYKIEPTSFGRWIRILRRLPAAVLWLCPGNPAAEENLRREAENRGLERGRLIIAPRLAYADNLARVALADLVLDTCTYNGGVTTSDALWAGVPVVTLQGSHYAARMGSSILHAAGLPELVTHNLEQYEALIVALAGDPDRLAALRRRLLAARSSAPLFDPARLARQLERAYREMWTRLSAGQGPHAIDIATEPDDWGSAGATSSPSGPPAASTD